LPIAVVLLADFCVPFLRLIEILVALALNSGC